MSLFSKSNGINYFVIQTPKDKKFDGVILLSSDKNVNDNDVSEFVTILEQYVPPTIRVLWVGSSTVWGAYPDEDKKLFLVSDSVSLYASYTILISSLSGTVSL